MKRFVAFAFAAALSIPAVASAQETAPDGTRAYTVEPYVGVLGGYHDYDRDSEFGTNARGYKVNGGVLTGIAGVNIGLGPVFVGAEGFGGHGTADIKWVYGARGRVGARAGESGMIYVSGGYQWTNGKLARGFPDRSDWVYGVGVEVGPKDIGLGGVLGESGPRIRLQAETYDFDSIAPMAGVVWHF